MTEGKIISAIAGYYWVHTQAGDVLCKPRGIFRKHGKSPAVGDRVRISHQGEEGTIEQILERKNLLRRPFVSNVDYCLLVFSLREPEPDLLLLDRLIVNSIFHDIEPFILFNKTDLAKPEELSKMMEIYGPTGFPIHFLTIHNEAELEDLLSQLPEGIYVLAGQSGVGKSSLLNRFSGKELQTQTISEKLGRGRHTTRNSLLLEVKPECYIIDTPGFQNLNLEEKVQWQDIYLAFPEFHELEPCQFYNCTHVHEPRCSVKVAVQEGRIHAKRYENYQALIEELEERRNY